MTDQVEAGFTTTESLRNQRGVSGWLLILCLSLTIVAPIVQIRIGGIALKNLAEVRYISSSTMLRLTIVGATYLGLGIFSIWAGIWLWLEDHRAVPFAKAYLLSSAGIVILLNTIMLLCGVGVDLLRVIFSRVMYSGIWYAYLFQSKRVRATYLART